MSHDIADEKLTYSSDGTPTYSVKLRNLNHLIRTMYNGKAVLGQTFTVVSSLALRNAASVRDSRCAAENIYFSGELRNRNQSLITI